MRLEVMSQNKKNKTTRVKLSDLSNGKTYNYTFDTDVVDFDYFESQIELDLKRKKVISEKLKELHIPKVRKFDSLTKEYRDVPLSK